MDSYGARHPQLTARRFVQCSGWTEGYTVLFSHAQAACHSNHASCCYSHHPPVDTPHGPGHALIILAAVVAVILPLIHHTGLAMPRLGNSVYKKCNRLNCTPNSAAKQFKLHKTLKTRPPRRHREHSSASCVTLGEKKKIATYIFLLIAEYNHTYFSSL